LLKLRGVFIRMEGSAEKIRERINLEILAFELNSEMDRLNFIPEMRDLYFSIAPYVLVTPAEILTATDTGNYRDNLKVNRNGWTL